MSESERAPESKAERRLRKEAAELAGARQLDGWERYRALSDLVDHLVDVLELADRRTRFALLILAALNAVNILIAVRAGQLGLSGLSPWFFRGYILLRTFFCRSISSPMPFRLCGHACGSVISPERLPAGA
jgi:hypothetical protein